MGTSMQEVIMARCMRQKAVDRHKIRCRILHKEVCKREYVMDKILDWIKDFMVIYLILTILTQLAATEQYKKYFHFFSGVILLLVLISPVLGLFGKDGEFEKLVSYEAAWEQLDSARKDSQKLEFLQNDHYIQKYEAAIAQDIKRQAEDQNIAVADVRVALTEDYEIGNVTVQLDMPQEDVKEAGKKLQEFVMHLYDLQENQVFIS